MKFVSLTSVQAICITAIFFISFANLSAQCPDFGEMASNGKCLKLSWTPGSEPEPFPSTAIEGGVTYSLVDSTGSTAFYTNDGSQNSNGCNNTPPFSGDLTIDNTVCTYVNGFLAGSAPLPVSLAEFRIELKENTALLNWITESELNNEGFEIEKSSDGRNWEMIGWENGYGNSNSLNEYYFTDSDLLDGYNYYRLKQVDFDGTFSFSNIISVNVKTNGLNDFKVFPNPAHQVVSFSNLDWEYVQEISIYNQLGKKVFGVSDFTEPVDVTGFNSGLYYVVAIVNNQKLTKKLMVH